MVRVIVRIRHSEVQICPFPIVRVVVRIRHRLPIAVLHVYNNIVTYTWVMVLTTKVAVQSADIRHILRVIVITAMESMDTVDTVILGVSFAQAY